MTINDGIKKLRLSSHSTLEDLECGFGISALTFGDKVLVAGYYCNGKKSYYGAVYEFLTDDKSCEGEIGLYAVSEVEFEDNGHAIQWAMQQ